MCNKQLKYPASPKNFSNNIKNIFSVTMAEVKYNNKFIIIDLYTYFRNLFEQYNTTIILCIEHESYIPLRNCFIWRFFFA